MPNLQKETEDKLRSLDERLNKLTDQVTQDGRIVERVGTKYQNDKKWLIGLGAFVLIVIGAVITIFFKTTYDDIGNRIKEELEGTAISEAQAQLQSIVKTAKLDSAQIFHQKEIVDSLTNIVSARTKRDIARGSTVAGSTDWKLFNEGISVTIDISRFRFNKTPVILTSIGGIQSHWQATGTSSVYHPTSTSFLVYLRMSDSMQISPSFANERKWVVNWVALPSE